MSRIRLTTLVFAAIGLLGPISILVAKSAISGGFDPVWIYYAWPSYFLLGGLAGDVDALVIAYVIVSILLNVALYGYVGSILGRVVNPGG